MLPTCYPHFPFIPNGETRSKNHLFHISFIKSYLFCVIDIGEKEPLDKRQKRMLLTRRKKQKHSRKEDKRKQKEEISEKNEEKKKSRKFFKKRKLHKKKQSVVTFKNIKGRYV